MFNYSWKIVVENIIFLTIFCQFSCTRQKAYLNGFILSRDSKFLGGPFMIKNLFWVNFQSFFGFNLFRLVFWVEDSLHIYIFLEMSFALASPFYCLPIFGDRLLYQTSGKFQSRLLEASFLHFCLIPGSCIWPQKFSMLIPHFWDISNLVRLWCAYVILELLLLFSIEIWHFKGPGSIFFVWKICILGPFSALKI